MEMNIFEKHIEELQKDREIFEKYFRDKKKGIIIDETKAEDFQKRGKELLPDEITTLFLQIRCQYYRYIVDWKLKEYSYEEWSVCLAEQVLLEYAIPVFSRVLECCPILLLSSGMPKKCILCHITMLEESFWAKHEDWRKYFVNLIQRMFQDYSNKELMENLSDNDVLQLKKFISERRYNDEI